MWWIRLILMIIGLLGLREEVLLSTFSLGLSFMILSFCLRVYIDSEGLGSLSLRSSVVVLPGSAIRGMLLLSGRSILPGCDTCFKSKQ